MNLDCIEIQGGKWAIIAIDKDNAVFCQADTLADAWYMAARKLEYIVNGVLERITSG